MASIDSTRPGTKLFSLTTKTTALTDTASDFHDAAKKLGASQKNVSNNVDTISQNHWLADTAVGRQEKNLKASFMALQQGMQVADELVTKCIKNAQGIKKIPVAIGAGLGFALYGLNIFAAAILKAAVWLPILTATTAYGLVGGGLGAIMTLGDKEAVKGGLALGAEVSDWIFSGTLYLVGLFTSSWVQPLLMYPALFFLKFLDKSTSKPDQESLQQDKLTVVVQKLMLLEPSSAQFSSLPFRILDYHMNKPKEMQEALQFLHIVHDLNAVTDKGKHALLCDESGEKRSQADVGKIFTGLRTTDLIYQLNPSTFCALALALTKNDDKVTQNSINRIQFQNFQGIKIHKEMLQSIVDTIQKNINSSSS